MRTGPFSDEPVVAALNRSFVPVYLVNEDVRDPLVAPEAERTELARIHKQAAAKGFSTGTVHAFVLAPDGRVVGTRHVADAARPGALLRFLDGVTAELGTRPGRPVVEPRPQSRPPAHADGALVLHLAARGLGGAGSWDGFAEDWVVYPPADLPALLPAAVPGAVREWDSSDARRLLTHVYPLTENNDPARNRFELAGVRVTTLTVAGGTARGRVDARVRMRHDFYHKPDGNRVDATLVGYLDWEPAGGRVTGFKLVTTAATYGGGRFAAGVRRE